MWEQSGSNEVELLKQRTQVQLQYSLSCLFIVTITPLLRVKVLYNS